METIRTSASTPREHKALLTLGLPPHCRSESVLRRGCRGLVRLQATARLSAPYKRTVYSVSNDPMGARWTRDSNGKLANTDVYRKHSRRYWLSQPWQPQSPD